MKRMIAALLCACMVTPSLIACSSDSGTEADNTLTDSTSATVAEVTEKVDEWGRNYIPSSLDDTVDLGGETVNFLLRETREWEFISDEETGDLYSDSIYARNLAVEEKLNMSFKFLPVAASDQITPIKNSVLAGDNAYDIATVMMYAGSKVLTAGYFLDLHLADNLHLDNPWWSQSYAEEMTINGKLYSIIGDLNMQAVCGIYCTFVNHEVLDDYNDIDMYEVVNSGEWTLDKLRETVTGIYNDTNGNNEVDTADFFGYGSSTASLIDAFTYACGSPVTTKDADGIPQLTFGEERTVETVNKLHALLFETNGAIGGEYTAESHQLMVKKFKQDELCFFVDTMKLAEDLRDLESNFGIFPIPKLREDDVYLTTPHDGVSITTIISTCDDIAGISAVLECMAEESYRSVIPQYYEVIMKTKYLRSDASSQMYDMILSTTDYNYGFIITGVLGASHLIRDLMTKRSTDFTSQWAAKEAAAKTALEEYIAGYFA